MVTSATAAVFSFIPDTLVTSGVFICICDDSESHITWKTINCHRKIYAAKGQLLENESVVHKQTISIKTNEQTSLGLTKVH